MSVLELPFQKVCEGIIGAEGPVFDTGGSFYAVAPGDADNLSESKTARTSFKDGIHGKLIAVDWKTGEKRDACVPTFDNYGGRPAGCQSDRENNIWIADMRLGILKYSPDEGCKQISKVDTDGQVLNGCNDLVFDYDGNLWVTGPSGPIAPAPEDRMALARSSNGCLYFLKKSGLVPQRIAGEAFKFCNGIAVKDDLLLVAETLTQSILAFDVVSPGELRNRRQWCKLPPVEGGYDHPMGVGGPDGMDFDETGRLLVAHHGGSHIEVFNTQGELESRIKCPFMRPSNVHFLNGTKTCFVTEHDNNAVWKFEWLCKGRPMYCDIKD